MFLKKERFLKQPEPVVGESLNDAIHVCGRQCRRDIQSYIIKLVPGITINLTVGISFIILYHLTNTHSNVNHVYLDYFHCKMYK